jgi:simple sugar transport system ATP-binding protein
MTARLELTSITKRYPSVIANDGISLKVEPGQIHAVLGENGAGKSTLMKIIYGAVTPDEGRMALNGQEVHIKNPAQARALGVSMVFQHFSLFENFTVAQNVWLGLDQSLDLKAVTSLIHEKAAAYGLDIEPSRVVHSLSVGEMQRVEIIRALLTNPQLLILDEPTSVLTPQAVDKLFEVLQKIASEGCSILYISHKLDEIRQLCSACTVLRAGRVTGFCNPQFESNDSLSRLMIGAEVPTLVKTQNTSGLLALKVSDLSLPSTEPFGVDLSHIDLSLHAGEVVGIAGVSGNGQGEFLQALSGEDRRAPSTSISIFNASVGALDPNARRDLGLHFVAEDRLNRGVVAQMSLEDNMLLTRRESVGSNWLGWIDKGRLREQTQEIIRRFNVKAPGAQARASSLSGGNLQKYIVGREIDANPKVLIVSQPTWGVDVGSSMQIRSEIMALKNKGCAVLVVSEDLDELFEMCDRLYVMAKGRLSSSLDQSQMERSRVGVWMSGLWEGNDAVASTSEG